MKAGEKVFLIGVVSVICIVLASLPTNEISRPWLGEESPVDWDNVVEDPDRIIDLDWVGIVNMTNGQDGCWMERNLEEKFNLKINPIFFDTNGFNKRLPLMLAGGDVPDVMWTGDPLGLISNLNHGFIMEVPYELILKHAPTYVHYLNKYGRAAWLYSQSDGKNFGLPTFMSHQGGPRIGAWRLDWLRNVGIERIPETIDEMHDALYAIRNNDPDGNGEKDTYGWNPAIWHWSVFFAEIFSAYDVLAFDFVEVDGDVIWGGITPGAKEALKTISQWYAEGLIDPDFLLVTNSSKDQRFVNCKSGYTFPLDPVIEYDVDVSGTNAYMIRQYAPNSEVVPAPPLRNAEGKRRGRSWGGAAHVMQFGKHLEKDPEKVIRVLKMFEAIAKDERLYVETSSGKEGLHWAQDPKTNKMNLLPPYADEELARTRELIKDGGFYSYFHFPSDLSVEYREKYLDPDVIDFWNTNRNPDWAMVNVLGKTDIVKSAGRYINGLRDFQMAAMTEIIVGSKELDSFDEFVVEWKRRGGELILKEANEVYRMRDRVFEKVGAL